MQTWQSCLVPCCLSVCALNLQCSLCRIHYGWASQNPLSVTQGRHMWTGGRSGWRNWRPGFLSWLRFKLAGQLWTSLHFLIFKMCPPESWTLWRNSIELCLCSLDNAAILQPRGTSGATHWGWCKGNTEGAWIPNAHFQVSFLKDELTCKLCVGCSRNICTATYHMDEGEVCVIATVLPAEIAWNWLSRKVARHQISKTCHQKDSASAIIV